jgi:acyl dehydratase
MSIASITETLDFDGIQVGEALHDFEIPVTATLIVAGAVASRDFMPVHHDRAFAQSQGSPDIFLNILTDNGLCLRYVTDWAGPNAMLRKLSIRLGAPSFPGSALTFKGSVAKKWKVDGEGLVEVAFTGTNDLGAHVSGTAVLSFPIEA